jgi:hypothetical protein
VMGKASNLTPLPAPLAELLSGPRIAGAACRGHGRDHDPAAHGEPAAAVQARHERAQRRCNRCPALDDCTQAIPNLDGALSGFVVAGRILEIT